MRAQKTKWYRVVNTFFNIDIAYIHTLDGVDDVLDKFAIGLGFSHFKAWTRRYPFGPQSIAVEEIKGKHNLRVSQPVRFVTN